MSRYNTLKMLKDFFEYYSDDSTIKGYQRFVMEEQLFMYEIEKGKNLFEMNEFEIFDMITHFNIGKNGKKKILSYNTYKKTVCIYNLIFKYYSSAIGINNPMKSPIFRSENIGMVLAKNGNTISLTIDDVKKTIRELWTDKMQNLNHKIYYECLILLFLNGMYSTRDIAYLDECDIDFDNERIHLKDRTIKVSSRCLELLEKVHNMVDVNDPFKPIVMQDWNGHYFKYPTFESSAEKFSNLSAESVGVKIRSILNLKIREKYNKNITGKNLYFLGFNEFIKKMLGYEEARRLITDTSIENKAKNGKLLNQLVTEYGGKKIENSRLKQYMMIFYK